MGSIISSISIPKTSPNLKKLNKIVIIIPISMLFVHLDFLIRDSEVSALIPAQDIKF